MTAGAPFSKYMGNDSNGGSSGGPWWLSISHRTAEYADTDHLGTTDPPGSAGIPGGPYLNGVNTHKRCATNCGTPPTTTTGVFWQELASSQFLSSGAADESEDIFASCFAQQTP